MSLLRPPPLLLLAALAEVACLPGGGDDAGTFVPEPCSVSAPTECDDPELRYDDVEPIFAARCVICHDGQGDEWPLDSHRHVMDWREEVRGDLLACTMPPPEAQVPMTNDERALILMWLRCGLPD